MVYSLQTKWIKMVYIPSLHIRVTHPSPQSPTATLSCKSSSSSGTKNSSPPPCWDHVSHARPTSSVNMGHSQIFRYKFWVSTRRWPWSPRIFSRLLSSCRDFKIPKKLEKKLTCGCWMSGSEQRCIWPTSNHATHQAHEWFWFRHPENSRWFCRILFPNHLKRVEGKIVTVCWDVAMKSTQTYEIHRYTVHSPSNFQ